MISGKRTKNRTEDRSTIIKEGNFQTSEYNLLREKFVGCPK
jgi:hypothetical protein